MRVRVYDVLYERSIRYNGFGWDRNQKDRKYHRFFFCNMILTVIYIKLSA